MSKLDDWRIAGFRSWHEFKKAEETEHFLAPLLLWTLLGAILFVAVLVGAR